MSSRSISSSATVIRSIAPAGSSEPGEELAAGVRAQIVRRVGDAVVEIHRSIRQRSIRCPLAMPNSALVIESG